MRELAPVELWPGESPPRHLLPHCRFPRVDSGGCCHGNHQDQEDKGGEKEGGYSPVAEDVVAQDTEIQYSKQYHKEPGQTLEGVPGAGPAIATWAGLLTV